MAKKYSDSDYLFLTALLRARQSSMISGELLDQMLSSGSFSEAARSLAEAGWPDMSGMDSKEIDEVLSKRRNDMFTDVSRMSPQPEVVDFFRVRYDYHNAKTLIKGEGAGVKAEHLLSSAGRVVPAKLEKAFLEDDYRSVPDALGASMREAKAVLARTGNPQLADFALDKAYFAEMSKIADTLGNAYAAGYVRLTIDTANLRTAVRCARMKKNAEFMESVLIPGGTVSPERLLQAFASGEGLGGVFTSAALRDAAALGNEAIKGGRLTAFELECDNVLNRYIADAKMKGFGAEAVIGYLAAEENNITAVRMVLTGLLTGVEPERLKERLRETYV